MAATDAPAAGDPLLMQGLEKRSARIQVEGPFVHVLDFLRSLENLQVFVITDDLSVVAARASKDEGIKVRLGLTLLAYGARDLLPRMVAHDPILRKVSSIDFLSCGLSLRRFGCGDDDGHHGHI